MVAPIPTRLRLLNRFQPTIQRMAHTGNISIFHHHIHTGASIDSISNTFQARASRNNINHPFFLLLKMPRSNVMRSFDWGSAPFPTHLPTHLPAPPALSRPLPSPPTSLCRQCQQFISQTVRELLFFCLPMSWRFCFTLVIFMAGGKRSRVQMVINPSPRRQMEKCDGSRRPLSGAAVASLSLSQHFRFHSFYLLIFTIW